MLKELDVNKRFRDLACLGEEQELARDMRRSLLRLGFGEFPTSLSIAPDVTPFGA